MKNDNAADALTVFISYSRRDSDDADKIVDDLGSQGFDVKIDRRNLPYGEEFKKELANLIAESDTVVWLVSPSSIESDWCIWELGEVARRSKRLVPVKIREVDPSSLPQSLGKIHLLPASGVYDPSRHQGDLVKTLNTDHAWLRKGTSLSEDAREWMSAGRDSAVLLRGIKLREAESWSQTRPRGNAPLPASEILELVIASRIAQSRRQRYLVIGSIAAAVLAFGLTAAAWISQQRAEREKINSLRNETISLGALALNAQLEGDPVAAAKLALSAWPRVGDDERPPLRRTVDALTSLLPSLRQDLLIRSGTRPFISASYSPKGDLILTTGFGKNIQIWDARTGELQREIRGPDGMVMSAELSSDGTRILARSENDKAHILDAKTGAPTVTLADEKYALYSAEFSPDGKRVVTALWRRETADYYVAVWDAETGKQILLTMGGGTWATFSPDGTRILSELGNRSHTAVLRDASNGTEIQIFKGHEGGLISGRFAPDGLTLVTASSDKTARIWNTGNGNEIAVLGGHGDVVDVAAFSPDGKQVATSSDLVRLWDASRGTLLATLKGHKAFVNSVTFSPVGNQVLTVSHDATVRVWSLAPFGRELGGLTASLISFDFSSDSSLVATGSMYTRAHVWDVRTGAELVTLIGHRNGVLSVAFSRDGTRIVTASADNTARVWDTHSGEALLVINGSSDSDWLTGASFSPDGKLIVTSSRDKTVRIWNSTSGEELRTVQLDLPVTSATFSPDGRFVMALSNDGWSLGESTLGQLAIFDAHDGTRLLTLSVKGTASASYSPDGSRIVTAHADGIARILDVRSGRELLKLDASGDILRTAGYSADGSRIVTAGSKGVALVWDSVTGAQLEQLVGHQKTIVAARFSTDGEQIATASEDSSIRIWDISHLEKGDAFQVVCERLGANIDLSDVEQRYGLSNLQPICGNHPPLPFEQALFP